MQPSPLEQSPSDEQEEPITPGPASWFAQTPLLHTSTPWQSEEVVHLRWLFDEQAKQASARAAMEQVLVMADKVAAAGARQKGKVAIGPLLPPPTPC
jgi:hypothetical protein